MRTRALLTGTAKDPGAEHLIVFNFIVDFDLGRAIAWAADVLPGANILATGSKSVPTFVHRQHLLRKNGLMQPTIDCNRRKKISNDGGCCSMIRISIH